MESLGLAAPRRKTKYDIDPRNNAWANDDNKFGQKLMEKFGWARGRGLGAKEDGETENIKVKVKNDKHGIGANNDYSDTWLDHQDDFNSILASLNTSHSAPGSGTATPNNEDSTDAVVGSMEERSKTSKNRVHYKKFTRSKDLTRANASDLDALFGRRKAFEKRSRKAKRASKSEPASPGAETTPLLTTPAGGNSSREKAEALIDKCDGAGDDGSRDREYDALGNLRTVTSSMSVSDYFAKKMAEIKARSSGISAAPAAVEPLRENSSKLDGNAQKKGEETGNKADEERGDDGEEEKPEVFAQEKFQAASLSVQQYFEQKMKEKKARQEATKSDVENNNRVDNDSTVCPTYESPLQTEKKKKKKKKKKLLSADGNVEKDALLEAGGNPKKKKKKKMKGGQPQPESKDVEGSEHMEPAVTKTCEEISPTPDAVEKKRKKRKRKLECENGAEAQIEQLPQALEGETEKKKKKKIKASQETTKTGQNVGQDSMGQGAITLDTGKKDGDCRAKKKKEKKRKILSDNCS